MAGSFSNVPGIIESPEVVVIYADSRLPTRPVENSLRDPAFVKELRPSELPNIHINLRRYPVRPFYM